MEGIGLSVGLFAGMLILSVYYLVDLELHSRRETGESKPSHPGREDKKAA